MLQVTYRKCGIKLTHIWFASEEEINSDAYRDSCGDLIFLHGVYIMPQGGYFIQNSNH